MNFEKSRNFQQRMSTAGSYTSAVRALCSRHCNIPIRSPAFPDPLFQPDEVRRRSRTEGLRGSRKRVLPAGHTAVLGLYPSSYGGDASGAGRCGPAHCPAHFWTQDIVYGCPICTSKRVAHRGSNEPAGRAGSRRAVRQYSSIETQKFCLITSELHTHLRALFGTIAEHLICMVPGGGTAQPTHLRT